MITLRHYATAYVTFAVGLVVIITAMAPDFRPPPIYQRLTVGPALPPPPGFHDGKTLSIEFDAPAQDLTRLHWYGMIYHPLQEFDFAVRNLARRGCSEQLLVSRTVRGRAGESDKVEGEDSGDWKWPADNAAGDRLRIELRWRRDTPPQFPVSILLARKIDPKGTRQTIPLKGWPEHWLPDKTLKVQFVAPAGDYDLIALPGVSEDYKTRIKIELFNLTTGKSIKKTTITGAAEDRSYHGMKPGNAAFDRLELRLRWQRVPPPALHLSGAVPRVPLDVRVGDKAVDFLPLVGLEYDWPTRRLIWLWIPTLVSAAIAVAVLAKSKHQTRPGLSATVMVSFALMAAVASCLSWQQAVGTEISHLDPDGFGRYAGQMVDWLKTDSPARRTELISVMDTWRYSWLPVTPLLIAVQLLCGVPFAVAYLIIAALASFGTLLLFHLLQQRYLRLGESAALVGSLHFLSHHFLLKSFAKPSTDPVGLLLVVSGLCLVCERLRIRAAGGEPGGKHNLAIGVVVFLHFGARPPGFLFAAFLVGAVLIVDAWSRRQLRIVPTVIESIQIGLVPTFLFGALFISFDWMDNFQAALNSSESFHHVSTARRFGIMSASMLMWLPLLWFSLRRNDWRRPEILLLCSWTAFYLALIVFVKAGFVTRMFLPILPLPLALTSLGLARLCERSGWRRGLGITVATLSVVTNVAIVTYHTLLPSLPPQKIAEWIYH